MRLSETERGSLSKYGCFLRVSEKIFYLDCPFSNLSAARGVPVLVRLIPGPGDSGCLLCVAFEVSPIRFLPWYSFCPLDMRKEPHRRVLESALQTQTLHLSFIRGTRTLGRVLALPKSQTPRMAAVYKTALDRIKTAAVNSFDFKQAVREFEVTERANQYFPWAYTEVELESLPISLQEQTRQAPAAIADEQRAFVTALFDALGSHGQTIADWMEGLPTFLVVEHFVYDFYCAFRDKPEQLIEVLSQWLTTDPLDVRKLTWVPEAVNSICDLLMRLAKSSAEQKKELTVALTLSVADFGRRLSAEGNISWKMLLESLIPIKPLLSVRPGRPRVDYSLARKLKREEQRSWTKVAEDFYNQSSQLQSDFGQPTFGQLSYQHKHEVLARVRGGVRRAEKTQSRN